MLGFEADGAGGYPVRGRKNEELMRQAFGDTAKELSIIPQKDKGTSFPMMNLGYRIWKVIYYLESRVKRS